MKKNISKDAVKAMAIAMAITLGSTNLNNLQEVKAQSSEDNSFNSSEDDSFNSSEDDSFNSSEDDSFNSSEDDSFNSSEDDSFNSSEDDSFNSSEDDSFNSYENDSFNSYENDSFNSFQKNKYNSIYQSYKLNLKDKIKSPKNISFQQDSPTVITSDGFVFTITYSVTYNSSSYNDGKVIKDGSSWYLVGKVTDVDENFTGFTSSGSYKKPHFAELDNGKYVVKNSEFVEDEKGFGVTFDTTYIGTPSSENLANYKLTNNGLEKLDGTFEINANDILNPNTILYINQNSFKNAKISGTLNLPKATHCYSNAFENAHIEALNLPEVSTIYNYCFRNATIDNDLTLPKIINLNGYSNTFENIKIKNLNLPALTGFANNMFKNAKISGTLNLPKINSNVSNVFEGATIKTLNLNALQTVFSNLFKDATIDNLYLPAATSLYSNSFLNATIKSNLNLPTVTSISSDNTFKNAKINGNLDLSKSTSLGGNVFENAIIDGDLNLSNVTSSTYTTPFLNATIKGNLDLSKAPSLLENAFKNAKIGSLTLNVTSLAKKIFENATIENDLDLSKVTTLNSIQLPFLGTHIKGNLDLSTATNLGDNTFKNAKIDGNLILSNISVVDGTTPFKNTHIKGNLDLSRATTLTNNCFQEIVLDGDLSLPNVSTLTNITNPFINATIKGDLNLSNATTLGDYIFKSINIGGNLLLPSITTLEDTTSVFSKANIGGNLDLSKTNHLGNSAFEGATIGGDLNLSGITSLQNSISPFDNTTIKGNLDLSKATNLGNNSFKNTTIDGNLDLSNATNLGNNSFQNTTIGGNLNLSKVSNLDGFDKAFVKTKINGNLDLSGISDSGNVSSISGTSKDDRFTIGQELILNKGDSPKTISGSLQFVDINTLNLNSITKTDNTTSDDFLKGSIIHNLKWNGTTAIGNANPPSDISDMPNIKNIEIPSTEISDNAFKYVNFSECTEFSNQLNNLTKIGNSAFEGAKLPQNISFNKIKKIGANAFANTTTINNDAIVISLPEYDDSWIQNGSEDFIAKTAFGTAAANSNGNYQFKLLLPEGSNAEALKAHLTNKNIDVQCLTKNLAVNISPNKQYLYRFQITNEPSIENGVTVNGSVSLVGFEVLTDKKYFLEDTSPAMLNTINDGFVTLNGKDYDVTVLGNGENSLGQIPYNALFKIENYSRMAGLNANLVSKVTTISKNAFKDNKEFSVNENLVFPQVTKICDEAFKDCSVKNIELPNVTEIGNRAFDNSLIEYIKIGDKLDSKTKYKYTSNMFQNCINLSEVVTISKLRFDIENSLKMSSSKNINLVILDKSNNVKKEILVNSDENKVSSENTNTNTSYTGSGGNISNNGSNIGYTNYESVNNNEDYTYVSTDTSSPNNTSTNKLLTKDAIKLPEFTGEAKSFSDVKDTYWAKSYIDKLSQAGILNGSNGNFNPNGQTKRADVTIMLVKLLGLQPEANGRFSDVNPNAYYAPYVGTASTYGIVNGSNGMFNPEAVISRQDTMVMISQILEALNINTNTDKTALNTFKDASQISSYAVDKVANLVNSGIISGNKGKLNPKAPVTRAEMATIMSKLYDVIKG